MKSRKVNTNAYTEVKKFRCDSCNFVSVHETNLLAHIKNMHIRYVNDNKKLSRNICKYKTNDRYNLLRHWRTHNEKNKVECDFCNFSSYYKDNLAKHIKKIHNPRNKEKKCGSCNYETDSDWQLKRRMNQHTRENKFECDLCSYVAIYKHHLNVHIERMHTTSNKNEISVTSTKTINDTNFECDVCSFVGSTEKSLNRHINIYHIRLLLQKCQLCDFETAFVDNLKKHVKNLHESEVKKCHLCDYSADSISLLNKHIDDIHVKEPMLHFRSDKSNRVKKTCTRRIKEFKCKHCSFVTNHRSAIRSHVNISHNLSSNNDSSTENMLNTGVATKMEIEHGDKNKSLHTTCVADNTEVDWTKQENSKKSSRCIKAEEEIFEIGHFEQLHSMKDEIIEVID